MLFRVRWGGNSKEVFVEYESLTIQEGILKAKELVANQTVAWLKTLPADDYIRELEEMVSEHPDWHWIVGGNGPKEREWIVEIVRVNQI